VDAACVMATQIPVTSQILMTRINCCAVVNTIRAVEIVTLAVLATSRRHGGSQKVTSLLYVNLAIVLDTPVSALMILKWTGSTARWTSTVTTKEAACARTAVTTLRVSTAIDANLATFAHLARA